MTGTVQSQGEAQVRQLLEAKQAAMRTRDAQAVVARYASDAVTYDLAPPLAKVGAEARDASALRNWFSGFSGDIGNELRDLTVDVSGNRAYCHGLSRLTATPLGAPASFTMWFRTTVCLHRVDGSWLITHEHSSTPFYMDGSFKAAVDLQP
ncbi:MAG: DUF4440 domain-containing protein [Pseudonocardiales bacterium]|nr:MAG: DUF4440 domain-containing protein [Pseudonocardiales bacterium]